MVLADHGNNEEEEEDNEKISGWSFWLVLLDLISQCPRYIFTEEDRL